MEPFHFTCPHCTVRLRIREKMFVGRQVNCPECGDLLVIVQGEQRLSVEKVTVGPVEAEESAEGPLAKAGSVVTSAVAGLARRRSGTQATTAVPPPAAEIENALVTIPWWKTPRFLAWSIAGCCAAAAFALMLATGSTRSASDPLKTSPAVTGANEPPGTNQDATPAPQPEIDEKTKLATPNVEIPGKPRRADAEDQLLRIGTALNAHREEHGHFPGGTVAVKGLSPERRLSWLAQLAVEIKAKPGLPVVWDRPWQDPLNDAFVRRRLHEFQNLAVPQLTGTDGYPATHFVGMAGVGADAARLALPHPRAGIFGDDRQTQLQDIADGTSQTIMVAGVQEHLGSWAAGGPSTVRGLTREPYVGGPDGFGTGQKESMYVLMADGSVRSLSAGTDPGIVRRMAAMADGLALDTNVGGEPGDAPQQPPSEQGPPESPLMSLIIKKQRAREAAEAQPKAAAIEAVVPPGAAPAKAPDPAGKNSAPEADDAHKPQPPKRAVVDLNLALRQKILKFEQVTPAPLIDILHEVAEMAGGTIAYDAAELRTTAAGLERPVALRLEKTTVQEILEKLLQPAGLAFRIEGEKIRIIPLPRRAAANP